jgi:hypothetical protein
MKSLLLAKLALVLISIVLITASLALVPMPGQAQTRVSVSMLVQHPQVQVWRLVGQLDQAANYLPEVTRLEMLTPASSGVGASRRLYHGESDWLDETVDQWYDGKGYSLRLHRGEDAPFPFAEANMEYNLQGVAADATAVHLSLVYAPRYGLLGQMLDGLWVEKRSEAKVIEMAEDLKAWIDRTIGEG